MQEPPKKVPPRSGAEKFGSVDTFTSPIKEKPPQGGGEKLAEAAEKKIAELEKSFADMKNNFLRAVADLENYKRRAIKEREEVVAATNERLLRELLEVKDHLELAVNHSHGATDVKPLHDGVTLTLKQMQQFMEKAGVTELASLGEPFNPAYHEAIHEEESEMFKPGCVVKEYQKGYLFNGRLLRAARVAVAREKSS